jgi:hypothetical protein
MAHFLIFSEMKEAFATLYDHNFTEWSVIWDWRERWQTLEAQTADKEMFMDCEHNVRK